LPDHLVSHLAVNRLHGSLQVESRSVIQTPISGVCAPASHCSTVRIRRLEV
jgi:hypothetical protein